MEKLSLKLSEYADELRKSVRTFEKILASPLHVMIEQLQKVSEKFISRGTGHSKFVRKGPTLSGVGGVIEDTTYLMNISETNLLALNFELTQELNIQLATCQQCQINKKNEV